VPKGRAHRLTDGTDLGPRAAGPSHRLRSRTRPRAIKHRSAPTVETFFTALLVVVFLLVTWFAGFVVVKLFKGQNR
jgi:hypothetical protein